MIADHDDSPRGKSKDQIRVSRRTLESEGDNEEDIKTGVVSIVEDIGVGYIVEDISLLG